MSDTTHEAPERIWITGDASKGSWNSLKANFEGPTETEYVRADRIRKLDRECVQWDKLFQRTYQRVKKAEAYAAELEAKLTWKPVETAPKDGRSILLLTRCHGVCKAWFNDGYWTADTPISPREYSGDAWVCCDSAFQIEVEFGPDGYESHGTATHWMPLPVAPAELKGQADE
jgi:hypothetical protein